MQAAAKEITEAYDLARRRGHKDEEELWRVLLLERLKKLADTIDLEQGNR